MSTYLFASLLTLLYLLISVLTIKARTKNRISLGYGKNNEIEAIVSAHSNFASYAPLFIFLLYILEHELQSDFIIVILGSGFLLGRILHLIAFTSHKMNFKLRTLGMVLTLTPLAIQALLLIYFFLK